MTVIGSVTLAGALAVPASASAAATSQAASSSYVAQFGNEGAQAQCLYSQGLLNQVAASVMGCTAFEVVTVGSWLGHPLVQLRANSGPNCVEYDASNNTVIMNACGAGAPGSDSWWYSGNPNTRTDGTLLSPNATNQAGGTRTCLSPPASSMGFGTVGVKTYPCTVVIEDTLGEWLANPVYT